MDEKQNNYNWLESYYNYAIIGLERWLENISYAT